jgi:hypothetical protein
MIVGFCRNNCRVSMLGIRAVASRLTFGISDIVRNCRECRRLQKMGAPCGTLPLEVRRPLAITCRNLFIKRDLNDVAHIR